MSNRNLVLIGGKSAAGKTASLRNLKNPSGVIYLACESGKELPFASKFKIFTVSKPSQVFDVFKKAEKQPKAHTIVIDSLTYLMDMFESQVVLKATEKDKFKVWSDYAQFFKELMQQHVSVSRLNVFILAHTSDTLNESDHIVETVVKVKGSLMNQGIESYFNNVITSKKVPLSVLENCDSPLLTITEEEKLLDFKYVFQTRLTKESVNERIRGPLGLWSIKEIFIDNDLQQVLDKLRAYYN